ncbi:MAG TPA: baseplate J/gp47 family protein [Sphingobium sp.]
MPFLRPTLSALIIRVSNDIAGRMTGAANAVSRSVISVLGKIVAGVASALYGYLAFIADQILPDTAVAEYLVRHAAIWGLRRKGGLPATGVVVAVGTDGTNIPAGSILVRIDGARFRSIGLVVVASGTADLPIEAELPGEGGNTPATAQLTFASPVAGVQAIAIVSADGVTGGSADEDYEALRARLLQRIRNPAQGGSKADYERWAREVNGVTRAWVYPLYLGSGTVGVTFVMDGRINNIPLDADVEAVQAHIDAVRPVQAALTVFAPIPEDVDIEIGVSPSTPEVKAAVEAELADLFTRDAEPGGTIYLSRLREAISIAQGEHHHVLEGPTDDFVAAAGHLPRLGTVSWAS